MFGAVRFTVLTTMLCLAILPVKAVDWAARMGDVPPEMQAHLLAVIQLIATTERGRFVLEHVSDEVEFRTKPMAKWGETDTRNIITLDALRLTNSALPKGSVREIKVKECFTAEILTHELLHNAQFHAGLFNYPEGTGGVEASVCELFLELEAKYYGEAMFHELCQRPDFKEFVQPQAGLFLVMMRQSQSPCKEYIEALWTNGGAGTPAVKLYREQVKEIRQWHNIYVPQAFGNNVRRFQTGEQGIGRTALAEHLRKIIDFAKMDVSAEFLMEHAAVEAIPHGIAGLERGRKKFELETDGTGKCVLRKYFDGVVQEQVIREGR